MDVTWTIRYEGPSYQDARLLQGMLEDHGVHVEPAPKGRERRGGLVERQQQERAEQSGALSAVTQVNHVVVDLESTGAAVAIAAAVKSFRNLALGGKVEVEGEARGKDDSG
jgi:hypothetical protein